ncbi:hypothetical protein [Aporhodopirellula aestuarii]|uniref:Uncharacterized protein n=1 Tax=Aporhodopirellula aestuarii TaxID=2950107 RepID=A0ABT0U370_9BACT|nr:hypothetical protein [Aporhodopirellula aestuarii]MCM2371338.1 hypothetical protein [Aporhodopirellula aestuarii]
MNPSLFPSRFKRIAPSLLPLALGILIGAIWASGSSPSVTAQTPGYSSVPQQLGAVAPEFGEVAGSQVTVIESRDGRDVAGSGDLIGFSHVDDSGTQVITIVDAEKRWMAVYHVGSEGKIRLVSSREIAADFTLELNVTPPLADQIRRMQGLPPRSN